MSKKDAPTKIPRTQKVIIPKGLIDPTVDTIIEIPFPDRNKHVFLAKKVYALKGYKVNIDANDSCFLQKDGSFLDESTSSNRSRCGLNSSADLSNRSLSLDNTTQTHLALPPIPGRSSLDLSTLEKSINPVKPVLKISSGPLKKCSEKNVSISTSCTDLSMKEALEKTVRENKMLKMDLTKLIRKQDLDESDSDSEDIEFAPGMNSTFMEKKRKKKKRKPRADKDCGSCSSKEFKRDRRNSSSMNLALRKYVPPENSSDEDFSVYFRREDSDDSLPSDNYSIDV